MKNTTIYYRFSVSIIISIAFLGCQPQSNQQNTASEPLEKTYESENPAIPGFNEEGSDIKAINMADEVMKAMGGRKQWDETRYLKWDFFGKRRLYWDKWEGKVRIENRGKDLIILVDIDDLSGSVFKDNKEVTEPDSLQKYLQQGKSIWINDSYWLTMPFKLKDEGVTLKYSRTDTMQTGAPCDVLTLTFADVGDTPNNKYEVYIDQSDHLVKQWAYFRNATQETASAIWPWDNYRNYNGILLSGDRSDNKGPGKIEVFDSLPDEVFSSFGPVNLPDNDH